MYLFLRGISLAPSRSHFELLMIVLFRSMMDLSLFYFVFFLFSLYLFLFLISAIYVLAHPLFLFFSFRIVRHEMNQVMK